MKTLVSFFAQRPDSATFLLPMDLDRSLRELFSDPDSVLPRPYKIYPANETQHPMLGFPVAESHLIKELDAKLDRWLGEEIAAQLSRDTSAKEKAQLSLNVYTGNLMKAAENALMSNLLADYHAIFWLAHSFDVARQFASLPRRIGAVDAQAARTGGDALKYRIFQRWVSETRQQMTEVSVRAAGLLEGEEQRGMQFFRLLQDDVLILTEEFIGPDLRELRSFLNGYLRRDFQSFRDSFERLRTTATDLLQRERSFRAVLPLFGANPEQGITVALLLDPRFENFLFEHQPAQNAVTREEREQFQLIARRLREYAVLNQLRRGIVWMTSLPDGQVVSADRRTLSSFSRSTRPMDFGRPGVVDPMIHRFGMIYDITAFSETLGNIRRGGGKEEIRSYRQMLLFQRKLDTIAQRHLLQFEKFLGDGAFYTTRRALRLARAAVEIQRFYSEMRRKGFSFNKGLRIALNYGYYRLLPMKTGDSAGITEFYGPGIVELSRLTTGKANKEIDEIASFLVAHGYDQTKVQQFFAPLKRGVDVIDHTQHAREYYAYLDGNGHLVNEGIVASLDFLQELSSELAQEAQRLYRVRTPWGTYIAFAPAIAGVEMLGVRLLGMVSLKGLDRIDVGEIVPFAPSEADEVMPIDVPESFVALLRQDFHRQQPESQVVDSFETTTTERSIDAEIVICVKARSSDLDDEVLIGEWDPRSDDVRRPLRLPRGDFQRLFSLRGDLTPEALEDKKDLVREMYDRLSMRAENPNFALSPYRDAGDYDAYVLGDVVEKL
ncbi:MAG TPA: hypothetical protein VNA69_13505 [Thermoanaerobaculia bacterium]|nr:hypothetical protein [Thermoanaerobaculia bacterium]